MACDLDIDLLDDPDAENEILVELQIYQNMQSTGCDRGVLYFDVNGLVFAGHRSSFSITWEDVELGKSASYGAEPTGPAAHRLRLKHLELRIVLSFLALSARGEGNAKAGDRLTRSLASSPEAAKRQLKAATTRRSPSTPADLNSPCWVAKAEPREKMEVRLQSRVARRAKLDLAM